MTTVSRRAVLMGACASLLSATSRARAASRQRPARLEGPLGDPSQGLLLWGVEARGYVAEEYLLRGSADVFESVSMADALDTNTRNNVTDQARRSFPLARTAEARAYCTRLVVYRPAQAARGSGTVLMETTHPVGGGSNIVWRDINAFFMDRGDTYVAVQHPATLAGLARANPARYGALNAVHPSQLWGMLADAGQLLKAGQGAALLGGNAARTLCMTGYSFTGVAAASFADYHHDRVRLPGGAPVFDAYVPMANAMFVKPLDVPVMRINTQSDFDSFGALANRAPDSGRFRHYEVAGAAHVWRERPQPGEAVAPRSATVPPPPGQPHLNPAACYAQFPAGSQPNDVPLNLVMSQAFVNLHDWITTGTLPPPSAHIEVDAQGVTQLDEHGNARGGVRLPDVSVPIATFGVGRGELCFLFGYRQSFETARRRELYGSKDRYVRKVSDAARQLVAQRWIAAAGAEDLIQVANAVEPF